jgi:uncharacterized protein DUF4159/aerotolerance regulator-like protein
MTLGPVAFLSPWLLAGLLALPVIWWLLRTIPPRPRRLEFPPTRILIGIENREKTPAQTPWWLTLIRMAAAALVILALAEPVLNPTSEKALLGSGPVVLVVDNGWAGAAQWSARTDMIERLIAEAEGQSRPVLIAPTAHATKAVSLKIEAPVAARSTAAAVQPQPFAPERMATAQAIATALGGADQASVVWLADGVDHDGSAREFADKLSSLAAGKFAVVDTRPGQEALAAVAAVAAGGRLDAQVLRPDGGPRSGTLHALSARGQRLGEASFSLGAGEMRTVANFDMPLELRNQVTRVEIAGERSAGAVHLLDARSQWHRVGLLSGASREEAQPLLAPLYYIERALLPFSEIAKSDDSNLATGIESLIRRNVSALMLADIGTLPHDIKERVDQWVKKGGILVRFAGPRLEKGGDDLLPVPLRLGGRTLGGALSWATPQPLAPFGEDSLFAGLTSPAEVLVNKQVLADPAGLGPEVKVWARLKDGTPLVTAAKHGDGQIIFFHVTANSDWSNLPLSGLFVDMLRRIAGLGGTSGTGEALANDSKGASSDAPSAAEVLAPLQVLDGFGLLKNPPPTTQAIAAAKIAEARPNADNPPGYYGPASAPRALNLMTPKSQLKPLPAMPPGVERRVYQGDTAQPIKPQLLTVALALLFADILAVLLLQAGGLLLSRRVGRAGTASLAAMAIAAAAWFGLCDPANAQRAAAAPRPTVDDGRAIQATAKVTFAYVLSGDGTMDEMSRQGLVGLGRFLVERTAVEPGEPFAVNILNDEIAFFPILYWPVLANARPLPEATLTKIDAYMKQGGMIIFDTKDYGQGAPTGFTFRNEGGTPLQRLLGNLDIPRLEPVPEHHVLTKSFYLLRSFPGRWEGGQLWVEAEAPRDSDQGRQARRVDGVSSILITSNDFAAAWARDERGQYLYPTVPGGERQREMALRTGVNIVMYALTGNYKADQVHVPALLERLGQ